MADTEVEGSDLAAIVADEIRSAQTFDQSKRAAAIEYMRGEMSDLPARPNGSSQTSRDVADVVSWMLPGIIRVFTASDQMVEFEATQEGGEQGAEEASEYTNYSFFRENPGYQILRSATYDSLQVGNGAAASYWCPEKATTKLFRGKTLEELALLLEEGWQGLGLPPQQTGVDDEGQQTFTCRLQKVDQRGQIEDIVLKPENLELSGDATTIEEARYAGYLHDTKTRSDLIEMADEYGWDKELIRELPSYTRTTETNEAAAARNARFTINMASPVKSGDIMNLREAYVRADRDGDGVAELLRVWCVGYGEPLTILSVDEWDDDVPFTDIPCYPVAHSWQAEGVYDRMADVQRVKTTLLRQALENNYAVNMPMREVEEGSVLNPDILVSPKFNGLIWKKKASAPIVNYETAYIADKAFAALEYMDTITARRTGVSKTTMALDPEALQNQSATGTQLQHDAAYSMIELVARDMAEIGWTKFFAKRRNLAKKYVKGQVRIPSRNGDVQQGQEGQPGSTSKYRTIQPEAWSDNMACSINVGLGTGSRDRDMAMLTTIQQGQIGMALQLRESGFADKAIEFIPKIRKAAVQIAEASGIKNPDDYYPEITDEDIAAMKQQAAQPQPDPAVQLEQMKQQGAMQLEQVRGQTQAQLKQVDATVAQHEAELRAQGDVVKNKAELEADLQTKAADRQNALQLEVVKQQGAKEIEQMRIESALQIKAMELDHQAEMAADKMDAETQAADGKTPNGDGTAKPKPKRNFKTRSETNHEQVSTMIAQLYAALSAPTEIVRGPDGRAVGTRKVMN